MLLYVASDAFTNAVEWIGAMYGLTRSAVGAVVAAIGSSLPETTLAAVALLLLRDPQSQEIGIGAVLGAPFMLTTIVFGLLGIAAYVRTTRKQSKGILAAPLELATFGLSLFLLTFALVVGASFAPTRAVRTAATIAVIALYAFYIYRQLRVKGIESDESPPRLRLWAKGGKPPIALVGVQLVLALAVTGFASRWFIGSVSAASVAAGLPAFVVSLFLSPIATELPEAMNVLVWLRRGMDELALGNVLGAMMFQTSIASGIAMLASPWRLGYSAYAACLAAFAAALIVLVATLARKRVESLPLALCGVIYLAFLVFVLFSGHSL